MENETRCSRHGKRYRLPVGVNPALKQDKEAAQNVGMALHGCNSCGLLDNECSPMVEVMWHQIQDNDPENYGVHVRPGPGSYRLIRTLCR